MANYEIAVMAGVLGTGFFLAYISDKFGKETFWGDIFKVFLLFSAFAMTLSVPTIGYYMIQANNGTNYTSVAAGALPTTYLSTAVETHMFVYQWVFIFMIILFIC